LPNIQQNPTDNVYLPKLVPWGTDGRLPLSDIKGKSTAFLLVYFWQFTLSVKQSFCTSVSSWL